MTIRILLADDHSVVRQGLRLFLSLDPDLAVVGEAANGAEAVRLAERLCPDVVLMDLLMPVMSGLEAAAAIRRKNLPTRVIVLTSVLEDAAVTAVFRAGAVGYLLKDTEVDELRRAIKSAAAGRAPLSPQVAARLLAETRHPDAPDRLSDRENEVLRLTAEGLPDDEIAARLRVETAVVDSYMTGIFERLQQAESRQQGLEDELAEARQIQRSLLPEAFPQVPGWQFGAAYESARLVGGDLYDFVEAAGPEAPIGLLIADVSGKGASAAMFMAHSRAIIRAAALGQPGPARALGQANERILDDNQAGLFISAFYAGLDTRSGRLTYANAGHNRPLWWRAATGSCQALAGGGMVLGVSAGAAYQDQQIELAPGDLLVLYTDGITEALNGGQEMFGEARLRAAIAAASASHPQQIVEAILAAVRSFGGETPQADDYTLVAVRRLAR